MQVQNPVVLHAAGSTLRSARHKKRLASFGINVIPVSPDLLRVTSLYSCKHSTRVTLALLQVHHP